MSDKDRLVCVARDVEHSLKCKHIVDTLYETFSEPIPCWITADHHVMIHGSSLQSDLAKTIIEMREFSEEVVREVKDLEMS